MSNWLDNPVRQYDVIQISPSFAGESQYVGAFGIVKRVEIDGVECEVSEVSSFTSKYGGKLLRKSLIAIKVPWDQFERVGPAPWP
jgi:hypothetical protein